MTIDLRSGSAAGGSAWVHTKLRLTRDLLPRPPSRRRPMMCKRGGLLSLRCGGPAPVVGIDRVRRERYFCGERAGRSNNTLSYYPPPPVVHEQTMFRPCAGGLLGSPSSPAGGRRPGGNLGCGLLPLRADGHQPGGLALKVKLPRGIAVSWRRRLRHVGRRRAP